MLLLHRYPHPLHNFPTCSQPPLVFGSTVAGYKSTCEKKKNGIIDQLLARSDERSGWFTLDDYHFIPSELLIHRPYPVYMAPW